MSQKNLIFLIVFLTLLLSCPYLTAEPSEWTKQPTYFEKTIHKLGFGANNFIKGWLEPYVHLMHPEDNGDNITTGLVRGTLYGAADVFGGMFHGFTCLIPVDLPLPEGGAHGFERNPTSR